MARKASFRCILYTQSTRHTTAAKNTKDSKVPVSAGKPMSMLLFSITATRPRKAARRAQCETGSRRPSLRKRKAACRAAEAKISAKTIVGRLFML